MKEKHYLRIRFRWAFIFFALFVLAGVGIVWMAERTIHGHGMQIHSMHKRFDSGHFMRLPPIVFTEKEKEAFEAFQRWVDSVKRDSDGRYVYDSLARRRPGLMDSVREVRRYLGLREVMPGP